MLLNVTESPGEADAGEPAVISTSIWLLFGVALFLQAFGKVTAPADAAGTKATAAANARPPIAVLPQRLDLCTPLLLRELPMFAITLAPTCESYQVPRGDACAAPANRSCRLPAYAPELNPVEYLFGYAKQRELANLCLHTIDAEFMDQLNRERSKR